MKFKTINRDWVKNAAIIFLAVLLVLTFFSNTIMNRSLPEVATQMVQDGSITAKVRGTGMVTANGLHEVKATQTREIRAVMIKSGQEVEAGDVLFVLGAGDSAELEAAQEQLRQLQSTYHSTAVGNPGFDEETYQAKLTAAKAELAKANDAVNVATENFKNRDETATSKLLEEAKTRLDNAILKRDELSTKFNSSIASTKKLFDHPEMDLVGQDPDDSNNSVNISLSDLSTDLANSVNARDLAYSAIPSEADQTAAVADATSKLADKVAVRDKLINDNANADLISEAIADVNEAEATLVAAQNSIANATAAYNDAVSAVKEQAGKDLSSSPELTAAQTEVDKRQAEYDNLAQGDVYAQALEKAKAAQLAAQEKVASVEEEKKAFERTNASVGVTLTDLAVQINQQKEKIKELSGEEADQIVANVAGTIESVNCTAGDTKPKDEVLCTIEVPDMGYTLSFSVTNDQAKRLRTGNTATVSNYYWGSEILAKLTNIKTDPKNPQSNKLLTFDLTGDVTAGAELTLSVGEKSANYDIIIPNSAIRSDTNGSFVLMIMAKNSPLGNRYIAQRVGIEVIAADDSNSAVTAALTYGDYVITTSNAPIKSGDQVRMAEG